MKWRVRMGISVASLCFNQKNKQRWNISNLLETLLWLGWVVCRQAGVLYDLTWLGPYWWCIHTSYRALAIDHGSHQDKAQRTLSFYNYINNLLPPVLWTSFSCFHLQAASVTAHGHQESRSLTVYRWRWTTWQLPKSKSKTSWSPPCWLAAGQVKSIFPEESFSHFRSTFDAIKKGDFLSWLHAIKSDGVHYCTDSGSANISGILWVCEEVGTHCSSLYMSTVQNY